MSAIARGPFDVTLTPQASDPSPDGVTLGRLSLEKRYHGELEAVARGEMLSVGTPVQGSATYVAVERVTGTLHGRRGAFALHHVGVMERGAAQLAVEVVPGSGTGELAGLAGRMEIAVDGPHHRYTLEYELPLGA